MEFHGKLEMDDLQTILKKRGLETQGRVQQFIDSEVLRLCNPYVPKDSGDLIRSAIQNGTGIVRYTAPYSRRWYYVPANFQEAPKRGNYWFERMKNEGGKEKILKGAKALAGAK